MTNREIGQVISRSKRAMEDELAIAVRLTSAFLNSEESDENGTIDDALITSFLSLPTLSHNGRGGGR